MLVEPCVLARPRRVRTRSRAGSIPNTMSPSRESVAASTRLGRQHSTLDRCRSLIRHRAGRPVPLKQSFALNGLPYVTVASVVRPADSPSRGIRPISLSSNSSTPTKSTNRARNSVAAVSSSSRRAGGCCRSCRRAHRERTRSRCCSSERRQLESDRHGVCEARADAIAWSASQSRTTAALQMRGLRERSTRNPGSTLRSAIASYVRCAAQTSRTSPSTRHAARRSEADRPPA